MRDQDLAVLQEGHGEQEDAIVGHGLWGGSPCGEEMGGGAFWAVVVEVEGGAGFVPFYGDERMACGDEGEGGADVWRFEDAGGGAFYALEAGEARAGGGGDVPVAVFLGGAVAGAGICEEADEGHTVRAGDELAAEWVRGKCWIISSGGIC